MVAKQMNKRAQLKIQQMAFMLLAVTLFFVFVGMFVLLVQLSGLRETSQLLEQENAMLLVTRLAESPEFSCGGAFGGQRVNCIDLDKARALIQNIDRYRAFWGVEGIEILELYPEQETIDILSYEGEGIGVSNFVALCEKSSEDENKVDDCKIGKIIVTYKS